MPRSQISRSATAASLAVAALLALAGLAGASPAEAHRWSDAQHMDQTAIAQARAFLLVHRADDRCR